MGGPSRAPESKADGRRRVVKAVVIIVLVLVLLVVVMAMAGGGGHGPGRHS